MEDLLIRDQHIANQIRMVEEEEMLRPDLVVSDVAVVARHCDHHRQWIARYFEKKLEWKPRLGTGRKSISRMRDPLESRDPHCAGANRDSHGDGLTIWVALMLTFGAHKLTNPQVVL